MSNEASRSGAARATLPRSLGALGVLFLTLSAATPASSVFVIVPGMLQIAGSGTLLALLLGAAVCWATAYLYAELSSAWPMAGGEYVMVARTLGPGAGFVVLGVNLFNNMLFPPVVALGVGDVLATVMPGLPQRPVALGVMAGSTFVALLNIRINAAITALFLGLEAVALLVLALLGTMLVQRPLAPLLLHPVMAGPAGTIVPATASAIGVGTTIAIFAFNGYGMAVYFGEEMRNARERIGPVILLALLLTLVAEMVPVATTLVGATDLSGLFTTADPFGLFVAAQTGSGVAGWFAIAVTLAIVNAAIVTILACARFFFATGRDGTWGARTNRLMAAVHPRLGSPHSATVLIGLVGMLCCFVPIRFLLVLSGGGLIVTYAALALAAMAGRKNGASAHGLYRMPLFPLAPLFTLAALAGLVWSNWLDQAEGRPGLLATAAQMVAAAIYYATVLRRRPGGWRVRPGPEDDALPMADCPWPKATDRATETLQS